VQRCCGFKGDENVIKAARQVVGTTTIRAVDDATAVLK
jgi:hypothetical protein